MLNHKSEDFKILYDIELSSDNYVLKAYKTSHVLDDNSILIEIKILEFETDVIGTDKITYVSPNGDCILIDKG